MRLIYQTANPKPKTSKRKNPLESTFTKGGKTERVSTYTTEDRAQILGGRQALLKAKSAVASKSVSGKGRATNILTKQRDKLVKSVENKIKSIDRLLDADKNNIAKKIALTAEGYKVDKNKGMKKIPLEKGLSEQVQKNIANSILRRADRIGEKSRKALEKKISTSKTASRADRAKMLKAEKEAEIRKLDESLKSLRASEKQLKGILGASDADKLNLVKVKENIKALNDYRKAVKSGRKPKKGQTAKAVKAVKPIAKKAYKLDAKSAKINKLFQKRKELERAISLGDSSNKTKTELASVKKQLSETYKEVGTKSSKGVDTMARKKAKKTAKKTKKVATKVAKKKAKKTAKKTTKAKARRKKAKKVVAPVMPVVKRKKARKSSKAKAKTAKKAKSRSKKAKKTNPYVLSNPMFTKVDSMLDRVLGVSTLELGGIVLSSVIGGKAVEMVKKIPFIGEQVAKLPTAYQTPAVHGLVGALLLGAEHFMAKKKMKHSALVGDLGRGFMVTTLIEAIKASPVAMKDSTMAGPYIEAPRSMGGYVLDNGMGSLELAESDFKGADFDGSTIGGADFDGSTIGSMNDSVSDNFDFESTGTNW